VSNNTKGRLSMDKVAPGATPLSRRQFLERAGVVVGGGIAFAACGPTSSPTGPTLKQFVMADYGGITQTARLQSWGALFTQRTGIPVSAVPLDYGKFKAQIQSQHVTWNWIDAEGWFVRANGDLLTNLPYDKIGVDKSDLYAVDGAYLPNGVASYLSTYAIGYRSEKKDKHPHNWAEFFDSKAVPGKRAIYNWPYGMIEIALLADGVPFAQLYPLDTDRAFKKLDTIKHNMIFWNYGSESQQFLVGGAADFVIAWHNRIAYLIQAGLPVSIEWGQNLQILTHHTISKYQPAPDVCVEFIKAAMDPRAQAQFATGSGNAPSRKSAYNLLDDKTKSLMSTNPDHFGQSVGAINDQWWGQNIDAVVAKWNAWASG